ncbi:MAG: AAA family ATPase [Rhodospirillales bacterium]|nr:AAA family ATPase [Rhodospirillales bacterium]
MVPVTLEQLAGTGKIDRFLMEKAADLIAALHLNAPPLKPSLGPAGPPEGAMEALFIRRRKAGCMRLIHGDLRLRNIALVDDQLTLINRAGPDCAAAQIDVVGDLAVLLRELQARGLHEPLNILFNRYFDVTGGVVDDPETLTVLRHFLADATGSTKPSARLVAIGGLSGGGKSRMSRKLAPFFACPAGARVVRTDVVRKRMMGIALSERLLSHGYTEEKSRQTYQRFGDELSVALAQGHSVIADAVFAQPEQRQQVQAIAERAGVAFCGLWVHAPVEVREDRVNSRRNNVSDVTTDVIQRQLDIDLGAIEWHQIDSSGPKDQTLQQGRDIVGV